MNPTCSVAAVFILDNPKRDLEGLTLVGAVLALHGIRTAFIPMNVQSLEIPQLIPKVVVLNYLRDNNAEAAIKYKNQGAKLMVLDTEGGVFNSESSFASTCITKNRAAIDGVTKYLCWGLGAREWLLKYGAGTAEQMAVTGAPRFDFYQHSTSNGQPERRNMILVNCNFSFSNPKFKSLDDELRYYAKIFNCSYEEMLSNAKRDRIKRLEFIRIATDLAKLHPDIIVKVRPHPFERVETYFEEITDAPINLIISSEQTIKDDISAAFAVVQKGCTTAIESHMLGVPTISPQWVDEVWPVKLAEAVSIPAASFDELNTLVSKFKSSEAVKGKFPIDEQVKQWFGPLDGQAYQRVANEILEALKDSKDISITERFVCFAREFYRLRRYSKMKAMIANWRQTDKYFDDRHVRNCFESVRSILKISDSDIVIRLAKPSDYPGGSLIDRTAVIIEPKNER